MPTDRNDSNSQDARKLQQNRAQFEADIISRQRNILPLDSARNEGQFYGRLIRGERELSGVQRIGFFFIGFMFFAWGAFLTLRTFPGLAEALGLQFSPLKNRVVALVYLPFAAVAIIVGVKVILTAVLPHKPRKPV